MSKTAYHKQLDDHILGNLTPAEEKEFEEHLRQCRSCQEELDQLKDVRAKITNLPPGIKPQRDLWAGIEKGLAGDKAADGMVDAQERRPVGVISPAFPKPLRGRYLAFLSASPYLRAAAVVVIVLGIGALWFALKNLRTAGKEVRQA